MTVAEYSGEAEGGKRGTETAMSVVSGGADALEVIDRPDSVAASISFSVPFELVFDTIYFPSN